MTAREELIRDLQFWACSPRVPQQVQLLILEAIGSLYSRGEADRSSILQEAQDACAKVSAHMAACFPSHAAAAL